ncbi:MAG: hypothetical protein KJN68_02675 [Bacteroidia bacterium]|nr:hypothetical protein [Bacteroidia bacterium]
MQIKKESGNTFQLRVTGYELATLISSSRWIVEGQKGELNQEAIANLKRLLANYDTATEKLYSKPSSDS